MSQLKAKPTEYKGIVYRSKCEAILARAIDLQGHEFIYEPERLIILDGMKEWCPDFSVMVLDGGFWDELIVEYKPAMITDTYRECLSKRFNKLSEGLSDLPFSSGISRTFLLICGNPYEGRTTTMQQYHPVSGWHEETKVKGLHSMLKKAKSYRFDLA